ncbi:hypothetical protein P152DRAFT_479235 [Eremomyces bilateralis CBS 781.70]|uniref:Uncharacterized protein n=1 Tax=Eremomyces bilateralis CBS 781.70 TaxID=1392243 RepID=A0A6G1GFH9_9PEZI|nr:uncharacterized protein P152DRAFT_479235 [Eremomyces bilateralis CBS 781.70]KAF1816752.1 hypothetical protein P152DRAFT_479235 [Eremomyces bilateralis CBS 781.70]
MAAMTGGKRRFDAISDSQVERDSPCTSSSRNIQTTESRSHEEASNRPRTKLKRSSSNLETQTDTSRRNFPPDATIVLLGVRGSGKSTLGIIASRAFHRKLVEFDVCFKEATGQTAVSYRKEHGATEHQRKQMEVMRDVLSNNEKDCVIICGLPAMDKTVQLQLQEYAQSHPVIHVMREPTSVHEYMQSPNEKYSELLRICESLFRRISNHEFYNVSERPNRPNPMAGGEPPGVRSPTPSLTLKRAERHFLKFITLICAKHNVSSLESAYPLSRIHLERRRYTYAVSVPLANILPAKSDMESFEAGADAFELVIPNAIQDPFLTEQEMNDISYAIGRIRRNTLVPIIYHAEDHSADSQNHRARYMDLIHHGLSLAPEYITIDLRLSDQDISKLLHERGGTKVMAVFTATEHESLPWNHEMWTSLYDRAVNLGFDLIRITRLAPSNMDEPSPQYVLPKPSASSRIPVIAYDLGPRGRSSACFNPILTTVTPEPRRPGNLNSPHITARDATNALFSSFVLDPMKFYIVGASSWYSLSPVMHNAAYQNYGMPHVFRTHQTSTLQVLEELVKDHDFGGAALTLPFKVEVIKLLDRLSRHAQAIGAVNTVIPVRHLNDDGSVPSELAMAQNTNRSGPVQALYGENTDWVGIRACIQRGLSPVNAVGPKSAALVIGAGGMARAAIYAMLNLGVRNIVILNRTFSNAQRLVEHFTRILLSSDEGNRSAHFDPFPSFVLPRGEVKFHVLHSRDDVWPADFRQPTIVVSCVPTHRVGNNPPSDFTMPSTWLQSPTGGVILEVAYKTLSTPLLRQIRAEASRGFIPMDGLDLLPEQGFAQFELFTGRRAPRRLMREEVLRNYRDENGEMHEDLIRSRLAAVNEQGP